MSTLEKSIYYEKKSHLIESKLILKEREIYACIINKDNSSRTYRLENCHCLTK